MTFCICDISQIQTTTPAEVNKPNRLFKNTRATFIRGGVVNSNRNGKFCNVYKKKILLISFIIILSTLPGFD